MVPEFSVRKSNNPFRLLNFLAVILAVLEAVRMVGFVQFELSYILLLCLMLIPIGQSLFGIKSIIKKSYVLFCLYLCFNLFITNPAPVFNSWERLLLFIVLIGCVSPMISNKAQIYFRSRCFYIFICIMSVLSVSSCFCYFMGVNYFKSPYGIIDYASFSGLFGGLFSQSMFLGPMAGISLCFMLWNYLRNHRIVFIILAVLSGGALLFSASRSAVISTICAIIVLIMMFYKKKTKALKFLMGAIFLMTVTFPLWESSLIGIAEKNDDNDKLGVYGSRTEKFEARMDEFEDSPIYGIGFASINPKGKDLYNHKTGTIEPGSSWLGTLSMTGIIGFLFVAFFILNAFIIAKKSKTSIASLMASLVLFFAIHMIFEGYIFAAGGPLCFIVWLVIGVASDLKYNRQ